MSTFLAAVLRAVTVALVVFGSAFAAGADPGPTYTLAILPSAPPVTTHAQWKPLVDRLAQATGLEFRLKVYDKMAEFERSISAGEPDFIFSSPIQIAVVHASAGYVPLVRARKAVAVGLFVRKDSPIRNVDDLMGRKISFVGNKNVCSVAMRHLMSKSNPNLSFEKEYAGSTRNVILNVLLGKTDAGSIFLPEVEREPEETRSQLREVAETPEIAPHPLSAHPRVPRPVREAVTKAVLDIAATADGAQLVKALRLGDPVPADYDRDYRELEKMNIRGFSNWGQ